MATKRETAQRERSEAREGRRNQSEEPSDNNGATNDEHALDGLKQAAKVAAASVALGAVAAAARALAERRLQSSDDEEESAPQEPETSEPEGEPEPTAEAQPEEPDEAPEQKEAPQEDEEPQSEQEEQPTPQPAQPSPEPRREPVAGASADEARSVADAAQEQLQLLVGKEPETISALERNDDGWLVTLEVLEVSRVPESTDVLASYEVELDEDRNLRRYARVRRYHRSQADYDGGS